MSKGRCLRLNWSPWDPFLVRNRHLQGAICLTWMHVSELGELSSGVPVPLHWLSRKPTVTRSHSGISFWDAWGKTCPSVGHLGSVEQQPLIYRAETCLVVVLCIIYELVTIWVLFPHWWSILYFKMRTWELDSLSLGTWMWVKVGQILFLFSLVYSPTNLTGFSGITML